MYASSSLSSSLHKIVLKIERSQITVTAAQFVLKCKWLSYQRPRFSHLTVWRGTRLATATTNEAWSLHPDQTPPPPHSFLSQVQDRKDLEKMHNHCTYGYVFSSPKTFCLWDQGCCSARSRVKNRNSQGQGFFLTPKIKQKSNKNEKCYSMNNHAFSSSLPMWNLARSAMTRISSYGGRQTTFLPKLRAFDVHTNNVEGKSTVI